jgi:hypothetical protein
MISKATFITKFLNEVRIIKHLASKATTPELLAYRFSEKQRTVAQLCAYLAIAGEAAAQEMINDDWSGFDTFNARYDAFDMATFDEVFDANCAHFVAIIEAASEEKLAEKKTMRGMMEDTRASHIFGVFNRFVAYKTQIFLQLKAAGVEWLGTMNLWAGMDAPEGQSTAE